MTKTKKTLAEFFRDARKDSGMSQTDVVMLTGIPHSTLSRIENGRARPGLSTASKLCRAYGVTMDDVPMEVRRGA